VTASVRRPEEEGGAAELGPTPTPVNPPPTLHGDLAEDGGVARRRAAVPATVAELFLALADGESGGAGDARHDVRVMSADEPLVAAESGRVIARGARATLRQLAHRLAAQRPPHTRTHARTPHTNKQ